MGIVMSGLSHLGLARNRSEFCLGLLRGLGSYLAKEHRAAFATAVFKLCGEALPDGRRPLDAYWNGEHNRYDLYAYSPRLDFGLGDLKENRMVTPLHVPAARAKTGEDKMDPPRFMCFPLQIPILRVSA